MKVDIIWLIICIIVSLLTMAVFAVIVLTKPNNKIPKKDNKANAAENKARSGEGVEVESAQDTIKLNFSEIDASVKERALENSARELERNIERYFEQLEKKLEKMLDEKLKALSSKASAPSSNLLNGGKTAVPQEKGNWSKEKSDLEEKLRKEQEKVAELQRQKTGLEARIHEMKSEFSAWRDRIAALEVTVKGVSSASGAAPTVVTVDEALKKELAQMDRALNENRSEIITLNDTMQQNQDSLLEIAKQLKENFKGVKAIMEAMKKGEEKGGKSPEVSEAQKSDSAASEELNNVRKELHNIQKELDEYKKEYDKVFDAYSRFRKDVHKVMDAMVNAKDSTSPEYLREVLNECMNTLYDKLK